MILRDAKVRSHIRIVQTLLDTAEVTVGSSLTKACIEPGLLVGKLGNAEWVVASLTNGHIHAGLSRLGHIGEEGISSILLFLVNRCIDCAGPSTKGSKRSMVHTIDCVRAGCGIAGNELASIPIQNFLGTRILNRAHLIDYLRVILVDRQRSNISPIHGEGTAAREEQTARIANALIGFIWRAIQTGFFVNFQSAFEAFVVHKWGHVLSVEERSLAAAFALNVGSCDRPDPPIGLLGWGLGNARAIIRRAVTVKALAVKGFCNCQIVIPSLRWLEASIFTRVNAILNHMHITIECNAVHLTGIGVQIAEECV